MSEALATIATVAAVIGTVFGTVILTLVSRYLWILGSQEQAKAIQKLNALDIRLAPLGQSYIGQTTYGGLLELIEAVDDPDDPAVKQITQAILKARVTELLMKRYPGLKKIDLEKAISDKLETVLNTAASLFNGKVDTYEVTGQGDIKTSDAAG